MDFTRWALHAAIAALLWHPLLVDVASARSDEEGDSLEETGEDAPYPIDPVEVIGERETEDLPSPDEEPTGFGTTLRRGDFSGERLQVAELLLRAPGTTIRTQPGGSTLSLRGSSPDQTLIFLDGFRITPSAGGGLDLRAIPLDLLEEITILRGNEGALYGAGALGGVALLKTREMPGGAHLSLSAGSFDTYALTGSVAGGGEVLSGLAAVALDQTGGDYVASFDPTPSSPLDTTSRDRITNNDGKSGALLLKGRVKAGDVGLRGIFQGSLAERGLPGTLYFRDTQRRAEQRLFTALLAEPSTPAALTLRGGVSYRRDAHSVWGAETASVISQPVVPGEERPWQIEESAEGKASLEIAPASFTFLRLDGAIGQEWMESPYHGRPERVRTSLGVVDELYLGDRITLAPALRFDSVGEHSGFSPKVGLSLRPLSFLELRGNVGRSFRVPTLGELYLVLGPVQPNPDLQPERGISVDGGVILRTKTLLAQVSAFYSRTDDLISYELVSGGRSKPFNFMDGEVVGGEAEAKIQPWRWLALSLGYGMARTKNLLDDPRFLGKELPYRPAHRAFGRIQGNTDGWEGFLEGHHQSSQWVNRSNTASLPSQTWFRVGAGRRLVSAPWEIWLSTQADNVFDVYLVDQLGFPRPGRAFFVTLRASSPGDRKSERQDS